MTHTSRRAAPARRFFGLGSKLFGKDSRKGSRAPRGRDAVGLAAAMTLETLEGRRLLSAGSLDSSFGAGGIARVDFPALADDAALDVLAAPGGNVLTISHTDANLSILSLRDPNGNLVATFGNGGRVTLDSDALQGSGFNADGVSTGAYQLDGKLLLIGTVDQQPAVVRLNSNGSFDTGFGNGGIALLSAAPGATVSDVAVDQSGRVVLGASFGGDLLVARFDAAGQLDTTFGGGQGYVITDLGQGANDALSGIATDGNSILAGGTRGQFGPDGDMAAVRYNSDGSLDGTFGTDGIFAWGHIGGDSAADIQVDSSHRVLLAGGADGNTTVLRLTAGGQLDNTFGNVLDSGLPTGVTSYQFGTQSDASRIALDSIGRIIVGGATDSQAFIARLGGNGFLDTSYAGGNGELTFSPIGLRQLAVNPDGSAYSLGDNGASGPLQRDLSLAQVDSNGVQNLSFGGSNDGFLMDGTTGPKPDAGLAIARQSDGKVIMAGTTNPGVNSVVAMTRYNANGSLDTSFGSGGRVITDLNGSLKVAVALGADGSIYLGASGDTGDVVAHYSSAGALDASFGSGGVATLDPDQRLVSIAVAPDGGIVVGGFSIASNDAFLLVKLNAGGGLDASFGTGGVVTTEFDSGSFSDGQSVNVLADGRLVLTGVTFNSNPDGQDIAVARYLADGTLDPSFGTGGKVTLTAGGSEQVTNASIDSAGNLLITGSSFNSNTFTNDVFVVRLSASGTPDATFGSGGVVLLPSSLNLTDGRAVVGTADGKVLLTGTVPNNVFNAIALVRLDNAGNMDSSFGTGGITVTAVGTDSTPSALMVLPSGSILVGGTGHQDFALLQYQGDVQPLVVNAGADQTINEGDTGSFTASATGGSGTLSYAWDLDNDGVFDDATGASSSHLFADNGTFTIAVRVTDAASNTVEDSLVVTVNNVAPIASVSGPNSLQVNTGGIYTLGATDPSSADQAGNFTFAIDWDGNGSVDQTVVGPIGTTVSHAFSSTGTFNVAVTATDKDGATSAAATLAVNVTVPPPPPFGATTQPDPLNPGKMMLVVTGSTGIDTIGLTAPRTGDPITVVINGQSFGSFSNTSRVVIDAGDGNDTITVGSTIDQSMEIYGGAGNDSIRAGNAGDIVVGGLGEDLLVGGNGRDLVIGGAGADRIVGDKADDILIAGDTAFDGDSSALNAIMGEWQSSRSYSDRVHNIIGDQTNTTVFASRLNGGTFLTAGGTGATVYDDGVQDVLSGDQGTDWFLFNNDGGVTDLVTDLKNKEFATDIDFISGT